MNRKKADELTISAKTENLEEVLSFVGDFLSGTECPLKTEMQIKLSLEEMFVNIAHYAYGDKTGMAVIRLELSEEIPMITITLIDSGIPYDPLAKPDPDITVSIYDRAIGGLGIFMTKKLMDEVNYEYRNGQNIFTMKKKIG